MTPAAWTLVTLLMVGFLAAAGLYLEATKEGAPTDGRDAGELVQIRRPGEG